MAGVPIPAALSVIRVRI